MKFFFKGLRLGCKAPVYLRFPICDVKQFDIRAFRFIYKSNLIFDKHFGLVLFPL